MSWKRKITGGTLAMVGFMLSPLSWWNDLFVNMPLAVAFGWLVACFWPAGFTGSVVVGYWLTNVIGLVLLHKGAHQALSNKPQKPYTRRSLVMGILISLLYTLLIVLLVSLGFLQPVTRYLANHGH